MTSYIMYDILKPSMFWKVWRRGPLLHFCGGLRWPWSSSGVRTAILTGYIKSDESGS